MVFPRMSDVSMPCTKSARNLCQSKFSVNSAGTWYVACELLLEKNKRCTNAYLYGADIQVRINQIIAYLNLCMVFKDLR